MAIHDACVRQVTFISPLIWIATEEIMISSNCELVKSCLIPFGGFWRKNKAEQWQ